MDLRKIKSLIDLVSESTIAELEITETEGTIRIVKSAPQQPMAMQTYQVGQPMYQPQMNIDAPMTSAEVKPIATGLFIKSPMVGTFYSAPSPGADSFVKVGDTIKKGQVLCIIEAMKLLNELEADQDGVIEAILGEDGKPVEYGQHLFQIR